MPPRPFTPKVITANALLEGDVIYLRGDGWTRDLSQADVLTDEADAELRLIEASAQTGLVVGVYLADVTVQDVAESLYIHPFMLSRWRKAVREGEIMSKASDLDKEVTAELKALRQVKRDYERLKVEHELLKKAIAFTSKRNTTSSPSSTTRPAKASK